MINKLFKGFIEIDNTKRPMEKYRDRTDFKSYSEIKNLNNYAGVLKNNVVLVDIDDSVQAEKVLNLVKGLDLNTLAIKTTRGIHLYFISDENIVDRNKTNANTPIGVDIDVKLGSRNGLGILKINGKERDILYKSDTIDTVPNLFRPINKNSYDFFNLGEGERNQTFFNYILTLQRENISTPEIREIITLINNYIIDEPLGVDELKTILRDESFDNQLNFTKGNKFLHDKFGDYLINEYNIIRLNGDLHLYNNGIYIDNDINIEQKMIELIPGITRRNRTEVLDYIRVITHNKDKKPSRADLIAFNNGIYDVSTGEFKDFSPNYIITNKIPWDYNPNAYDEHVDRALNEFACNDLEIRYLLEEVIGYTFYRRNELGKAFILVGGKRNGKSTFLEMIQSILGGENYSVLDLGDLNKRFNTVEIYRKLANIGDDISDNFIKDISVFKKLVTGEEVTAERKGQDPFKFKPYAKHLFSANEIPRARDKTGAMLRRLVIVPFDNYFDPKSSTFDPFISDKLSTISAMEYSILLGLKGLRRVLKNKGFTESNKVNEELEEYNKSNNPILLWYESLDDNFFNGHPIHLVYQHYKSYCQMYGYQPESNNQFGKTLSSQLGYESKTIYINKELSEQINMQAGKRVRFYVKE